jgi:curved DNA-binding protein CbpA
MPILITWYDVLGVLPDAAPDDIREAWLARTAALGPAALTGAPPDVMSAADRARQAVAEAGRVLADPAARESYDERIGVRRPGEGLASPGRGPLGPEHSLGPGWSTADQEALEPYSDPHGRTVVPDVRGLFFRACMEVAGRVGLHVAPIQLTEHPLPVEGLVVGQSPAPGEQLHRDSTLTVQLWHPSKPDSDRSTSARSDQ